MVAAPLQNIVNRIFSAIPSLINAAAILLVYWALAAVARLGITRLLGAVKFDSRAEEGLSRPPAYPSHPVVASASTAPSDSRVRRWRRVEASAAAAALTTVSPCTAPVL